MSKGDNPVKILVSGDVNGQYKQLFHRVESVNKKAGPFDMLLCVGNFFGDNDTELAPYLMGQTKVVVPTFILGPNKEEHSGKYESFDDGILCKNVTYLGKTGIYTGSSGLTVAYVSGVDGSTSSGHTFTKKDVDNLRVPLLADPGFKGVDILLTSSWPKGIDKYATSPTGVSENCGSLALSQLALSLKPRYHFSALEGVHYERQPYRNHKVLQQNTRHVTRFIALAGVGNTQKKKYLYAFNISPMRGLPDAELTAQPSDVTECPYTVEVMAKAAIQEEKQREHKEEVDTSTQFFFNMEREDDRRGEKRRSHDHRGPPDKRRSGGQPQGPCWFCLGSPEVEKHLVVSVGLTSYVALAKGGLVPEHVLICPIAHHPSLVSCPADVLQELDRYKAAITECFRKQDKVPVFWERNYKSQHLQIQVVPLDADKKMDAKEVFDELANHYEFALDEIPKHSDLKQIVPFGVPYFYVELPSGERLLRRIKGGGFPIQFGREALCDQALLNLPERVDWRGCKGSRDQEDFDVTKFREAFKQFDFNDDDE